MQHYDLGVNPWLIYRNIVCSRVWNLSSYKDISTIFLAVRHQVDDLQVQLDKEASRRSHLEKLNAELKDQLASLKSLSRGNDQLERSKRQLEEEVLDLRRRMEATQIEQSHVEQYRRDAEDRARQEIQQKLEQVNLFLQVKIPTSTFCLIVSCTKTQY